MRVLMVVRQFYPWIGGTERQVEKLSKVLIAHGIDVKVITGWWFRNTPQRENVNGIPVYRNLTLWEMFGIRGLRKFGAYLYILTLFLYLWRYRRKYDIIHIHLLNYHAFAAILAGKWFNKRTIVKIANSGSRSDMARMQRNETIPGARQMLPVILKADRFIAVSRVIADELRAAGILLDKILEIPNGVETAGFIPKKHYQLHDPVTLVFVGRLHPQKRLHLLLPAFQKAATARPELRWRLLLVGDGHLRPSLEALVQELGGSGEVIFCGKTDNVQAYLDQSDIFVLPSQAEGMSNALLEAMACGLPCIVSRDGGNLDLIDHEQNGWLVECTDTNRLAQTIIDAVDNRQLREKFGREARHTIENNFAVECIANQYIALYQELAKTKDDNK